MRLRTRAFLLCFLPFALLLAGSFWMIQRFVQSTDRDGLRNSLREGQISIAKLHSKSEIENSRFLKVAGENSALKAGIQVLLANPKNLDARSTVEDQLRELGEHMGFDVMLIYGPEGSPLAGVAREGPPKSPPGQLVPVSPSHLDRSRPGLLLLDDRIFEAASVPIDENNENIGALSVGEYFDLSAFTNLVVLVRNGKVIDSNLPGVSRQELEIGLRSCKGQRDCDLNLQGATWVAIPMQSYGGEYALLSLENVDEAAAPIQAKLDRLFLQLASAFVLVGMLWSVGSSNSIAKPIATVVSHLRKAIHTGRLSEIEAPPSSIIEIQQLAQIYNQAAISVQAANDHLESAYLEFVGSLANALDARDPYTAGHSRRVSELSRAVASAMQMETRAVERIRIGALLHDIGKIGIADEVLQKRGRLTCEEYAVVKLHPVIGRRILEGVHGFADYLPAVELHHENWDGTGYPRGLSGEDTSIDARIIHVADAYDAMTTDRSYRRGFSHERAISILIECAGTQFDPRVADVFVNLPRALLVRESKPAEILNTETDTLVEAPGT
jgi:HD-GYP domain-containing protein (c-di-GMP phosphodiesterase class II)